MANGSPADLKNVLSALDTSQRLKHWHKPPKDYGPDNPEFSEYNRNTLTDPGDLSMISFTEEKAFESSSDEGEAEDAVNEEEYDEESFEDDLPTNVVKSQDWMDPAEVTKKKDKIQSLQIAEQARHQNLLLMRMQEIQLDDECKNISQRNTVSHYQNYIMHLKELKREHQLRFDQYYKERDEERAMEVLRLRRQEEERRQTSQQKEKEYVQYIQEKSSELTKLVEDAERKEAEDRNLIQGLVNELHTLKASYVEKHLEMKQLLIDLNGDQNLNASVETMHDNVVQPVNSILESVATEVVSKNGLADVKRALQQNITYAEDIIQALHEKKKERDQQEAERATQEAQQASYEESQARLKAEQEKQQLAQQHEQLSVDPAKTSEEDRQAMVLNIHSKRFEDLKKRMEANVALQSEMDNERKKEIGRISTIINQLDSTNDNVNREKLQKLLAYLGGRNVNHNNKTFCTNSDPVITAFAKFKLIKDMVKVVDTQAKDGAGIAAYAWLIVSLMGVYPDLWDIFLYHIYTACPYLVPLLIYPKEGQSHEDFDRERGKRPKEQFDVYLSRMANAALLFGLVLGKMSRRNGMPEEAPVVGWKLVAGLLTLDPSPCVSAEVLRGFLSGVGADLQKAYGKQFAKLMDFAMGSYWLRTVEVTEASEQSNSSNNQLEALFNEYKKTGKLKPHEYIDKLKKH